MHSFDQKYGKNSDIVK